MYFTDKRGLSDKKASKKSVSSVVLLGKKSAQGTAYFIKNAFVLGYTAKEIASKTGLPTIAVLFRDANPIRSRDEYERKWKSMLEGFKRAGYDHGVPMIPRQIMEAWLLDSLDWKGKSHPNSKTVLGGRHSAYPCKEKLAEILDEETTQYNLVSRICDSTMQ